MCSRVALGFSPRCPALFFLGRRQVDPEFHSVDIQDSRPRPFLMAAMSRLDLTSFTP